MIIPEGSRGRKRKNGRRGPSEKLTSFPRCTLYFWSIHYGISLRCRFQPKTLFKLAFFLILSPLYTPPPSSFPVFSWARISDGMLIRNAFKPLTLRVFISWCDGKHTTNFTTSEWKMSMIIDCVTIPFLPFYCIARFRQYRPNDLEKRSWLWYELVIRLRDT